MRSIADIERDLEARKRELDELVGTETEIYSRIVGYYRSVRNWNKGKREEYRHRVTFAEGQKANQQRELAWGDQSPSADARPGKAPASPQAPVDSDARERAAAGIASCTYFYRQACPNCKPVRNLISEFPISVIDVDVDTDEGMELAVEHQILATPTALFADSDGRIVYRSSDPQEIAGLFKAAV